ncbi:tryptophan synthase subunit alpha [candidate division KSB1 bacterium]|nr:tryptophan synthase subunit alpha [candidate division KSB1 bacterium]
MNLETYIRNRLKQKPIGTMTHVIAGYPSFDDNLTALRLMKKYNVDLVEIQMPFSEPTADGPVFVKANQEALKNGITVDHYFDFMKQASQEFDFPILMMGYYNTALKLGHKNFIQRLKNAGGAGFILPDLPLEEQNGLFDTAASNELSPILLVAPTTPDERLNAIGKAANGFVYVVARSGVTGDHTAFNKQFETYIQRCRNAIKLPLAVGFGVSQKKDIEYLTGKADIAIIGTALLRAWEYGKAEALEEFLDGLLGNG